MTTVAAWPRRRAELACRWSPTGRDNVPRAGWCCRPSTPSTAGLNLHLDRQSNPLPLADCAIERANGANDSRAYPSRLATATKSPYRVR